MMDLRTIQKPLKDRYRADGNTALITLHAEASTRETVMACSVDLGRAILEAEAHSGVGGSGGACSGDLLLGALAACAQITSQMVATAMQIPFDEIRVTADGDLDLRGTLGIAPVPVGFSDIRLQFQFDAPEASTEQLTALYEKSEKFCVVLQTLLHSPRIESTFV